MNDNKKEYLNPTWDQIEASLRKLDGLNFSYIQLSPSKNNEEFLVLGGGKDGKYLCFYYYMNESYCVFNPLETCNEKVEINIGKVSERNKNELINIDMVLSISKIYSQNGKRDDSVNWREF